MFSFIDCNITLVSNVENSELLHCKMLQDWVTLPNNVVMRDFIFSCPEYDLGRSWKPAVNLNLSCHSNITIGISYILVYVSSWCSKNWQNYGYMVPMSPGNFVIWLLILKRLISRSLVWSCFMPWHFGSSGHQLPWICDINKLLSSTIYKYILIFPKINASSTGCCRYEMPNAWATVSTFIHLMYLSMDLLLENGLDLRWLTPKI